MVRHRPRPRVPRHIPRVPRRGKGAPHREVAAFRERGQVARVGGSVVTRDQLIALVQIESGINLLIASASLLLAVKVWRWGRRQ